MRFRGAETKCQNIKNLAPQQLELVGIVTVTEPRSQATYARMTTAIERQHQSRRFRTGGGQRGVGIRAIRTLYKLKHACETNLTTFHQYQVLERSPNGNYECFYCAAA